MTDGRKVDPTSVAHWQEYWRRPFGPKEGEINWRGPNAWTAFAFVCALVIAIIASRPLPNGWTWSDTVPFASSFFALITSRIGNSYQSAINEFVPRSPVEAKRANEQIKASAGLMNAAAAATLSIFALSEIVRSETPSWGSIVIAAGAAFYVHMTARNLLGHLVDEAVPT